MSKLQGISFFDRYLSVWVALCIIAGIALGKLLPVVPETLGKWEYANVSIPIAILIWIMIFPMMLKIDFTSIVNALKMPRGLTLTLVVNWLIKPFTMFGFAWLFFNIIFKAFIPEELAKEYLAGRCFTGRCTLHRNGFCLEPSHQWKSCLYFGTGCHKRFGDFNCLYSYCNFSAWG
jgi:ACR3 family arsenite transporter